MKQDQNTQPFISVIMPVWNMASKRDQLELAISSILNQTYTTFEFIIIDDSSTDDTLSILNEFAQKDSRIKVVTNRYKKGVAGALNTGLDESNGQFIARMDSDDISLPTRFEKQVEYLLNNPDRIVVGTSMVILNEQGEQTAVKIHSNDHKELYKVLMKYTPISHPTAMVRAEPYKIVRYNPDVVMVEDIDMWFRLSKYGKFGNLTETLYQYRLSNSSASFKNIKKNLFYAIKTRIKAVFKYGYKPSFMGLVYTTIQAGLLILPGSILNKLYQKMRFQSGNDTSGGLMEIIRYVIVGVLTVLIDWGSYVFINKVLGVDYLLSDILNLPIFLTFNYIAHKYFTFKSNGEKKQEIGRYIILIVFNQIEALVLLAAFTSGLGFDTAVSKFLQIFIMPLINYFLLKFFVFKNLPQ